MARKLSTIFILSLFVIAFLAVSSFGLGKPFKTDKKAFNRMLVGDFPKHKLAGAEGPLGQASPGSSQSQSLGFVELPSQSSSPGLTIGYTTYDYQSNGRVNRQVDWRGSQDVHFCWMKCLDSASEERGTSYEAWDAAEGDLVFLGPGGGIDIHAIAGGNRSGYVGLDVSTEGAINISNHHSEAGEDYMSTTVWYDFSPLSGFFSPYKDPVPDSTMESIPDPGGDDEFRYIWPSHEYQVHDGDTVTHVFAQQSKDGIRPQVIAYFRRVGSDTVGSWDFPPVIVDTVMDIAQTVTASRVSGKVALVWIAGPGAIPGDPESVDRGSQVVNDLYYAMSNDMGGSWSTIKNGIDKFNVTKHDSSKAGWLLHTDLSCLIDTEDRLHIVWDAREYSPSPPPNGSFPHVWGSRLFHWDDETEEIRTVHDANWDIDPNMCRGGAWNGMSIVKMQISECDGKFYTLFVQYNDIAHGIEDDCHEDAFTAGYFAGGANGELWISVSDNKGYNWDIPRNLTNSYTPHCHHEDGPECDADHWPSMSRFGMQTTGDFTGVPIVDPSEEYTGDYYLDVFYVNDKMPGGVVQEGAWTYNPLKWFRVACVTPIPNPVLSTSPSEIGDPTWTKPGVQLDTTIRIENIGNAELTVYSITTVELKKNGWLEVGTPPTVISHLSPNYYDLDVYLNHGGSISTGPVGVDGYLIIESDAVGGSTDTVSIHLIVADSVQFPEKADIRTGASAKSDYVRIVFNNAGNIGDGGSPVTSGKYNMNLLNDCDTTGGSGTNDNAFIYLYDASPFILQINDAGDTVINCYIFDADWLADNGFRPLEGIVADTTSYSGYQYGYTGKFLTKDSSMAVEVEYFAPSDAVNGEFVVMKQRVYNNSGANISNIFVGQCMDWDIPSDTAVENGSGFDAAGGEGSRDLMYMYGGEYGIDTLNDGSPDPINDCVWADQRYGGLAFYNGYKLPFCEGAMEDSLQNPAGPWWTHMNADYVYPTGGFVGGEILQKIVDLGSGFEAWESSNPSLEDSLYQDLHMIATYGQFDLGVEDTLVFVSILTTTYNGLSGIQGNVDLARTWIANHSDIFTWPERVTCGCCDVAGDANNSGSVNMLDITYLISFLYKGGPAPPCAAEGDANGSGSINMLDITYLISYLYKGGPAPICGPE